MSHYILTEGYVVLNLHDAILSAIQNNSWSLKWPTDQYIIVYDATDFKPKMSVNGDSMLSDLLGEETKTLFSKLSASINCAHITFHFGTDRGILYLGHKKTSVDYSYEITKQNFRNKTPTVIIERFYVSKKTNRKLNLFTRVHMNLTEPLPIHHNRITVDHEFDGRLFGEADYDAYRMKKLAHRFGKIDMIHNNNKPFFGPIGGKPPSIENLESLFNYVEDNGIDFKNLSSEDCQFIYLAFS